MYIPENVRKSVKKNEDPLDNNYLNHAFSALKALNRVTEETYCYDDMSRAANVLERVYKGFLDVARSKNDWYQLPEEDFLTKDHDILGVFKEIKKSFPDVYPREDRDSWRATVKFLIDLRREYTNSRYISYPTYEDFVVIRKYVNDQYNIAKDYLKSGKLEEKDDNELKEDY